MKNAVIDTVLGSVKRWGRCDFTGDGSFDGTTETQVALVESTTPVSSIPIYHNKIVAGVFTEMSPGEKTAADAQYGPIILEATAEAEQTNGTTTLQNAVVRSIPANRIPLGKYEASLYCEIAVASVVANSGCVAALYYQGIERLSSANDKTQYVSFSGSAIIDVIVDQAISVEVKFAVLGAANTAKIRRVRISLVRQS